jgi:hypothetical protein
MKCKICDSEALQEIISLPLETSGKTVSSQIVKCLKCNTYSRTADYSDPEIQSHFTLTSYTDLKYEKHFLECKKKYFEYLLQLIKPLINEAEKGVTCLDIGSSYGHMLDIFAKHGLKGEGVEIVDGLRTRLQQKGYNIYKTLPDIPRKNVYDIITWAYLYL